MEGLCEAALFCLNPENHSVSEYSLDLLQELVKYPQKKPVLNEAIQKTVELGNASFISDQTVEKILMFYQ